MISELMDLWIDENKTINRKGNLTVDKNNTLIKNSIVITQ
jgi:hypothetical protein